MNLLLDTYVALCAITDHPSLSKRARELNLTSATHVWISSATIREIAIKFGLARGDMPISSEEAMRYFKASGYRFLSIEPEHAQIVETLPDYHRDPFDRILIAQALFAPMRLMTHDSTVAHYSETIILV